MNLLGLLTLIAILVSLTIPQVAWIPWALVILLGLQTSKPISQPTSPEKLDKPLSPDLLKALFMHNKASYLKSEAWNTKRKLVLQRDSYTCQCCNTTGVPLDVHHLSSYSLIPQEPTSALISLCRSCHEAQHLHYGYPQTLEDYNNWNTTLYKGHL